MQMLSAERGSILQARDRGVYDDEVLRSALSAIDLEESMLDRVSDAAARVDDELVTPIERAGDCEHLRDAPRFARARTPDGCEECLRDGMRWVHLRLCLDCGHVGCCDSSVGKHAAAHYAETEHPVMRSIEPGEAWRWCFVDDLLGLTRGLMQTFLPVPDFAETARILDDVRLGKQRVETYQIIRTLDGVTKGWRHHPAVKMWRGHEACLLDYGLSICAEWDGARVRRHRPRQARRAPARLDRSSAPPWLGDRGTPRESPQQPAAQGSGVLRTLRLGRAAGPAVRLAGLRRGRDRTGRRELLGLPSTTAPAEWLNPASGRLGIPRRHREAEISHGIARQRASPEGRRRAGVLARTAPFGRDLADRRRTQKSMSPPGMPPPAGAAAFSGLSATTASVVRNSAAMDAAFCSAERVTLAGSTMPSLNMSTYSPVAALSP